MTPIPFLLLMKKLQQNPTKPQNHNTKTSLNRVKPVMFNVTEKQN